MPVRRPPTGLTSPRVQNAELQRFLDQVAQRVSGIDEEIRNQAEAAGTGRVSQAGPIEIPLPVPDASVPELDIPIKPVGFEGLGGFAVAVLSWENPYRFYRNHGQTRIYRSRTNRFDEAAEVGQAEYMVYADTGLDDNTVYYYWIRFESTTQVLGPVSEAVMVRTALTSDLVYNNILDWLETDLDADSNYPDISIDDPAFSIQEIRQLSSVLSLLAAGAASRIILRADRFAIVPTDWDGRGSAKRIPFAVIDGITYLDLAMIRDASIEGAKIRDATINNAKIVDATITGGKIRAQTIIGNLIAAATLRGSHIIANTITAREILLGQGIISGSSGQLRLQLSDASLVLSSHGVRLRYEAGLELTAQGIRVKGSAGIDVGPQGVRIRAGPSLEFDTDENVGVKAGAGIDVDSQGVRIRFGNSLEIDNDDLEVKAGDGLDTDSQGLKVVTGAGIDVNSRGIYLRASTGLEVDAGNNVKVKGGNGIDVDAGGVKVDAGNGIDVDAGGVKVDAGNGIDVDAGGVKVDAGNGIIVDVNGVRIRPADASLTVGAGGISLRKGDGSLVVTSGGVRVGDLQSSNFVAGSRGWRILKNGTAEFDAAAIRGILSADHIDADVRNVTVLYRSTTGFVPTNSRTTATWVLFDRPATDFDFLEFFGQVNGDTNGQAGIGQYPTNKLGTGTSTLAYSEKNYLTIDSGGGSYGADGHHQIWLQSGNNRRLYLRAHNSGVARRRIYGIIGVKRPS